MVDGQKFPVDVAEKLVSFRKVTDYVADQSNPKEKKMIQVTDAAGERLNNYLAENTIDSPVRVYLAGGCSGSALSLALDQEGDNDEGFDVAGVKFLVDKNLLDQVGGVTIDYITQNEQSGFIVKPDRALPQQEGHGCGGGCCC